MYSGTPGTPDTYDYKYTTMTGAEFNEQYAGTKMYKILYDNMIHFGYKYKPNALNGLDKLGEQFDPNPDCRPGGLYFCAEPDVIKYIDNISYPLIALVEIPADARISVGEHKFKTDKLILGQPIEIDVFFSDEYVRNLSVDYLKKPHRGGSYMWHLTKRMYLLDPERFEWIHKTNLLFFALRYRNIGFLNQIKDGVRKMLEDPQIERNLIGQVRTTMDRVDLEVINWLKMYFPQYAALIGAIEVQYFSWYNNHSTWM